MCHSKWVLLTKCQRVCVGRHVQVKENDGSIRCHMVTHQVLGSHLQQPAVGQDSKIPPRIAHKNATQLPCNLHHMTCQVPTYHWLRIDWECFEVLYLPAPVVVTGYNSAMSACQKVKHWMLGLHINHYKSAGKWQFFSRGAKWGHLHVGQHRLIWSLSSQPSKNRLEANGLAIVEEHSYSGVAVS